MTEGARKEKMRCKPLKNKKDHQEVEASIEEFRKKLRSQKAAVKIALEAQKKELERKD